MSSKNYLQFRKDLRLLVIELLKTSTELSEVYRNNPRACRFRIKIFLDLAKYYHSINNQISHPFESKLSRWMKSTEEDFYWFLGETNIADLLRRHDIQHHFIQESSVPAPDIELEIAGEKISFEIKTVHPDSYMRFGQAIKDKLELEERNPAIQLTLMPIYAQVRDFHALVSTAVELICGFLETGNERTVLEHSDQDGTFSIWVSIASTPRYEQTRVIRTSWPEGRILEDGTHFLEHKLRRTLKSSIQQFSSQYQPTFLVWHILDRTLDSVPRHASQVIQQYGRSEFSTVAGIIISIPVGILENDWTVIENDAHPQFKQLKQSGVFESLKTLREGLF